MHIENVSNSTRASISLQWGRNGQKKGLSEQKSCPVMIEVFSKTAYFDTIYFCERPANFFGWNYTSNKYVCVIKPPRSYFDIIENNWFVQKKLVQWCL